MGIVVGIDLGTTNSCVAYVTKLGTVETIPNSEGNKITPSVVQINSSEEIVVGDIAKKEQCIMPEQTISFAKRFMDRPTNLDFKYENKQYSAIEISAFILKKIKNDAEAFLNDEISGAVITVPAYFDMNAKQATMQAAEIAGIKVLQLVMEPSAASIFYSFSNANSFTGKRVAVYDFGGGTFDISIIDMNGGEANIIATGGDPRLGGKDIDNALVEMFKKYIKEDFPEHKIDFEDKNIIAELWETAEDVKKTLSNKATAKVKFRFLKEFRREIEKTQFEKAISHIIEETLSHVRSVIEEAGVDKKIEEIIFVGGSTRIPIIELKLEELLGLKPLKNVNPDEAVALGAALLAKSITFDEKTDVMPTQMATLIKEIELKDIVPHSIGFLYRDNNTNTMKNHILIQKGMQIPCKERTEGFYFTGNSVMHQVTQGESEDPELVEIIGDLLIKKDLFESSNTLIKGDDNSRTNIADIMEYTTSGTIISKVIDLSTKKEYVLEIQSKDLLSKKEILQKKDEMIKTEVE